MNPRQLRTRNMQRQIINHRLREPETTDAPLPNRQPIAVASAPVCDHSGDAGTRHYWPEGAQVGDMCLCGKRKRFTPFPKDAA